MKMFSRKLIMATMKEVTDHNNPSTEDAPCTNNQPVVIDDKDILRRSRISDANRGNQPWNKGRK